MQPLIVTALLEGPVIRGRGQLTLDALLSSAIFDRTADISAAHDTVPVYRTEGLYWASRAIYEPFHSQGHAIVQSFRPDDVWLDPQWLKKNKHGLIHTKFSNLPDPVLNSYRAESIPSMTWYCTGDEERIRDLLDDITHIGKKRSALVKCWTVESGDLDGLHGYLDEPLRPVPVALWDGDRSGVIVDAAWAPAYWDVIRRTACYI